MFQEITRASRNLRSSLSLKLAEDLSWRSTPGSLGGPDGRHSDWDTLGTFVVGGEATWGSTPKLLLISTNPFSFLFLFFFFLSLVIVCLFFFFVFVFLCFCVFVFLCFCIFVFLCFCVFFFKQLTSLPHSLSLLGLFWQTPHLFSGYVSSVWEFVTLGSRSWGAGPLLGLHALLSE